MHIPSMKRPVSTGKLSTKWALLGLLGLNVPEEFGGAGVDAISAAIAIEELGWGCGSTALAIAAHNGLGCAPLTLLGNQLLKEKFLPPAASGKGNLAALALTEPGADRTERGRDYQSQADGNESVLKRRENWCTNASIADFIVTLARTGPDTGSRSLSLIVVPTNTAGIQIGPAEKKMGLKALLRMLSTMKMSLYPWTTCWVSLGTACAKP